MSDYIITLAAFSLYPAGRYRKNGPKTAEQWRDDYLIPALNHALEADSVLIVDLCATRGISASFLEEAFGGLLRQTHTDHRDNLRVISNDLEVIQKVQRYMNEEIARWGVSEEALHA